MGRFGFHRQGQRPTSRVSGYKPLLACLQVTSRSDADAQQDLVRSTACIRLGDAALPRRGGVVPPRASLGGSCGLLPDLSNSKSTERTFHPSYILTRAWGLSWIDASPAQSFPAASKRSKCTQLISSTGYRPVAHPFVRRWALQVPRPTPLASYGVVRHRELGRVGVLPLRVNDANAQASISGTRTRPTPV